MTDDIDRGRLNVYLGELKEPWFAYCKREGAKPGPSIKQVVAHLLRVPAKASGEARIYGVEPVSEPKKRIEVKLTASERSAADERAQREGFPSTNLWVAAVVRAALTNMPQFGRGEVDALGRSNHELLAIGRNLNQITKHLNASNGDPAGYNVELVEKLAVEVRRHVSKVGDLLRASIYRWKLKA